MLEKFPTDILSVGALWAAVCQRRYLRTLFNDSVVCRPDLFSSGCVLDSDAIISSLQKDDLLERTLAATNLIDKFYRNYSDRLAVAATSTAILIDRSASYV
jgi:hypothetical protein